MLEFDPRAHRYRNTTTGRFVRYAEVIEVADNEVLRLEVRLMGHARLFNSGKIDIAEFQTRMALSLKESHLRMAMLGAGGKKRMDSKQYGHVGQQLRKQYEYLHQFGQTLEGGTLTEEQVLRRAKSYAKSVNIAFRKAELVARGEVGFYAKRLLDPQAKHCAECISYQQLQWTIVASIVPPGVDCSCGGRCRCRLVFRN
jgi:hypothetical protein